MALGAPGPRGTYKFGWVTQICAGLDLWLFARFPSMHRFSSRGTLVVKRR